MLGWWFVVRHHTADESGPLAVRPELHLATWETGDTGIRWIESLVASGIARKILGEGYPNRYAVPAAPVLDLLLEQMNKPPAAPTKSSDWREGKFVTAAISACPRNEQLIVEAWDLS